MIGRELHVTWGYNVLFDPGGSHIALALLAEAGDYRLLPTGAGAAGSEERVRSGIGWFRAGIAWSRPAYQFSPFLGRPRSSRGPTCRRSHPPRPHRPHPLRRAADASR